MIHARHRLSVRRRQYAPRQRRVQDDLKAHLANNYGAAARDRYWQILEELRAELGYVDYLGALERYRVEALHRPEILRMSSWLVDYPFAERLYPGAFEAIAQGAASGPRSFCPMATRCSSRARSSAPGFGARSRTGC